MPKLSTILGQPISKKTTNRWLAAIFLLALLIRGALLFNFHDEYFYAGTTLIHGEIARNTMEGNYFSVDHQYLYHKQQIADRNLRVIPETEFTPPTEQKLSPSPIVDAPFYGTIQGLIWRLTGAPSYLYVQVVQAFIDALMIFLIFSIANNLFRQNKKIHADYIALLAAFLYALYLPEAKLAIHPLRDAWGTFGNIILFWGIAKIIAHNSSTNQTSKTNQTIVDQKSSTIIKTATLTGIGFSLCALFRPSIIFFPIFITPFLFLLLKPKKIFITIGTIIATTVVLFWTPLIAHNLYNYNRILVGPAGQSLWAGLGEFDNDFGAKRDDFFNRQTAESEGMLSPPGTIEYDNHLRQKATKAIQENPGIFVRNLFLRIPKYLTLDHFPHQPYSDCRHRQQQPLIDCVQKYPTGFVIKLWHTFGFGLTPWIQLIFTLLAFCIFVDRWRTTLLLLTLPAYTFLTFWHVGYESRFIIIGSVTFLIIKSGVVLWLVQAVTQKIKWQKSPS